MIAVTGVTGALGGRVAARLAAAGDVPLRLVVRDAGRAPRLAGAEVREHPGGYADPAGLAAALSGVETLYLVSAAEAEDRLRQHLDAVGAAATAGVRRIVCTSFVGARPDAVFTLVRQHAATETPSGPPASGTPSSARACTRTSCRSSPRSRTAPRSSPRPPRRAGPVSSPATTSPTSRRRS